MKQIREQVTIRVRNRIIRQVEDQTGRVMGGRQGLVMGSVRRQVLYLVEDQTSRVNNLILNQVITQIKQA